MDDGKPANILTVGKPDRGRDQGRPKLGGLIIQKK
jgi:hypothetical protein